MASLKGWSGLHTHQMQVVEPVFLPPHVPTFFVFFILRMRPLRLGVSVADDDDGGVSRRRRGFEMPLLERRVVLAADEAEALARNV
jgi:hypothetical protein